MDITVLTLGGLAVWRVTHLLHTESGPVQIFERIRVSAGVGFAGQVLACFYCLSLWVAAPLALWGTQAWDERLLLWLSLSAVAILLERLTTRTAPAAAVATYREDVEPENSSGSQQHLFP